MDDLIFDEDAQLIRWRPRVSLEATILRRYYQKIAAVPWGNSADRYTDLSQVPSVDLDYNEMQRVTSFRRSTLSNQRRLKLAIFAPEDLEFATSRMYQSLMSDENMEIMVSRDLDEIATFLGRPLEAFVWTSTA